LISKIKSTFFLTINFGLVAIFIIITRHYEWRCTATPLKAGAGIGMKSKPDLKGLLRFK